MSAVRKLVIAVSLSTASLAGASMAVAKSARMMKTPNCEINGKKHHYRSKAACEKKKGKWLEGETTTSAPAPAAGNEAAPAPTTQENK